MSFINAYAQSCLPPDTCCGVEEAKRAISSLSSFIRKINLESSDTKLTKLSVRNPPFRILPALTCAFEDAWSHDRVRLIASAVTFLAAIVLGIIMLTKLTVGLMPLSLALIIAGIAFSVLKSPVILRFNEVWSLHRAKFWTVCEQRTITLPAIDSEKLSNAKDGSDWEDPISQDNISRELLKTPKVIVVCTKVYLLSSLLGTLFSTVIPEDKASIPHPESCGLLSPGDREALLNRLSLVFCVNKGALANCWDTGTSDSPGVDIPTLRKQKFQKLTGYTLKQLEEFEKTTPR